ncbi:hypothetical protein A2U01_0099890, partial [Trifolium medium]|nr:hypothetical protein [Trifolium medium]
DLGPEALRNKVANSSVAVLKLLEVVSHLNGREGQYLKERDAARKRVSDIGLKLTKMEAAFDDYKNKYALQEELIT